MKFNKKSLVKVAILSAILGLNGMCFGSVVNGAEVMLMSPGGVIDPKRQQDEPRNDVAQPAECMVCFEEAGPARELFTMGCCGANVCPQCLLDYDQRKHRCPKCEAGDEASVAQMLEDARKQNMNVDEIEKFKDQLEEKGKIYKGTIMAIQNRKAKVQDPANENPDNRKPEKENMENDSLSNKVNKKPIRLSDEFTIGLSNREMKRLGGWKARFAAKQNKYAADQVAELNEQAWELSNQDQMSEEQLVKFNKLYDDDALSYRTIRQITMEDARDAILEKTSSNCSQNACCESARSESISYQPQSFTNDALSDSQVQELIDQGYFN